MRRYHDAVADFVAPADAAWRFTADGIPNDIAYLRANRPALEGQSNLAGRNLASDWDNGQ
jgi:hypothetical protein